ncbi:MAG: GNAT family N-acetyltransferase [Candidatus Cybelea sp.]
MAEIAAASPDDVRRIQRRRNIDEAGLKLSLQAAEAGRVWSARDGGEVIGIAVAHDSETERYVGELFVEPSYRGQEIGSSLIEAAFGETDDAGRAMLVAAGDDAALALALRYRMAPREMLLRFAGAIPREEELAKMAAGDYRFQVDAIDPAIHSGALNELDRQARGVVRPGDHAEFARSASGHAFFLSGECVGYAYVWPDGRIGPTACASEAYLVQILAYALVTLQRGHGASWCTALVPSSNRRIARALLRAGLRIEESFLLAHDSFIGDMSTYVAYHRMLL